MGGENIKVYVPVRALFNEYGRLIPLEIIWEDGTIYEIEKVLDVSSAPARKAGGQGDRYMIEVRGKKSQLFFERSTNLTGDELGRWFVERKGR